MQCLVRVVFFVQDADEEEEDEPSPLEAEEREEEEEEKENVNPPHPAFSGFRVQGSEFRIPGLGFGVEN